MTVVAISALTVGYFTGYVEGRRAEFNSKFRSQKAGVMSVIEQNKDFSSLRIDRFSDGSVIVIGTLTASEFVTLKREVERKLGESATDFALSKVNVVDSKE